MAQVSNPKPADPIIGGLSGLVVGATYPLQALVLFWQQPKLRQYVLVPILINVVVGLTVYAGLLSGGLWAIDALFNHLSRWIPDLSRWAPTLPAWFHWPAWTVTLPAGWHLPQWQWTLPAWLHFPAGWHLPTWQFSWPDWLRLPTWQFHLPDWVSALPDAGAIALLWLARSVLVVTLLLVTGFIFLQFGVLLGAPWYGKLSEEIERLRLGSVRIVDVGLPREIGRSLGYELKKLAITFGIGLPLLLLQLFLGPGTLISTAGGITLAATIVCMDFLDAAVERRRPRFRKKLAILIRSLPASASFALVCLSLVSLPLVNLLAIPLCVAAGTLFACDRILPWLDREEGGKGNA